MGIKKLLFIFLSWRVLLFTIIFSAIATVPLQFNFLGGGLTNYLHQPYLWSWANYDGEHYLNIAQNGYGYGEQAFFPFYPFAINKLSFIYGRSLEGYLFSGLSISNIFLVIALFGLAKLISIDYSKSILYSALTLFLLFPTSFYFGSVYSESLFLALIVWSFYFARRGNWILAGTLGGLASGTRVVGVFILPALIVEFWIQEKNIDFKKILPLLLVPAGLFYYLYYLYSTTGDPLKFVHVLPSFGEQRQITPIMLPRVFYRYIFRIIPNLNYYYFPVVFTTFLEFITASLFSILVVLTFIKLRLSYAVFSLILFIFYTLPGSFSSLPRYVLIIFPAFLVGAIYLDKLPKIYRIMVYSILFISLVISLGLFTRGYWVS